MRTPTANGFASMCTPAPWSIAYVSRAECPIPRNTARAGICSDPFTVSAAICPAVIVMSVTCAPKRTSPPIAIIFSRRHFTTVRSTSVPICGFCRYRISSGAPAATNASMISFMRGSRLRAVSFPSENVPAPPSPNWTFDAVSSRPVRQNCATSRVRRSTSCPRSRTSGAAPARASSHAAKIPAGPNPTMTGRSRPSCGV